MTRHPSLWIVLAASFPAAAFALAPDAGSVLTAERLEGTTRIEVPVGRFADGGVPTQAAAGDVTQRAWRLEGDGRTPYELLEPMLADLAAQGFETLYECRDVDCGGFDFRFAADLLPEPAMHVDLGDFHYLAARRAGADGDAETVSIFTSRSARAGFIHVTEVAPATVEEPAAPTLSSRGTPDRLVSELLAQGRVTLDDVAFGTGAADLDPTIFASIRGLAEWLAADPARRLTLVGHTDSQGDTARNVALSEARAGAVRDRLVDRWGVDAGQLSVVGLGPAEPRAPNDTPEGRRLNRRVEAVLQE